MEFIREIRSTLYIVAGFCVVLGLIMLLAPSFVSNSICYLIGAFCLILGGLFIYIYIGSEVYGYLAYGMLITAIALIVLGVFVIMMPDAFLSFLPLVMGLILAIDGLTKLLSASSFKRYNYEKWWQALLLGFIVFILGIFIIFRPLGALHIFIRILGCLLIVDSFANLFTAISYGKIEKAIK